MYRSQHQHWRCHIERSSQRYIGRLLAPDSALRWTKKAGSAIHKHFKLCGTWTSSRFGHALTTACCRGRSVAWSCPTYDSAVYASATQECVDTHLLRVAEQTTLWTQKAKDRQSVGSMSGALPPDESGEKHRRHSLISEYAGLSVRTSTPLIKATIRSLVHYYVLLRLTNRPRKTRSAEMHMIQNHVLLRDKHRLRN